MEEEGTIKDEDACPICANQEILPAHECENCGRDVCQDCYNFDNNMCEYCDNSL